MNKKTKNFSDLSKKQKDKIISDSCEGANEEQAELLEESKRIKIVNWITDNLTYKNEFGNIELSLSLKQLELLLGFISKLLEEEKKDKHKTTPQEGFIGILTDEEAREMKERISLFKKNFDDDLAKRNKEISRLKHKDDDEPTKANYYAKGYRDGMKETINSIIETLKEEYKQIK